MVAPHTTQSFPSGDVNLSVRRFGARAPGRAVRTPVLFVHGLSYFSYDWVDFGTRLCSDREGCAMDMRGFGDSSPSPTQDYSVPAMANDIGHLLDGLQWPKAIIVAHSMGGRSATCFTARNANRVAALVLVDWSPENAPEGSKRVATTVANTPDSFATVEAAMQHFGIDANAPAAGAQRERLKNYLRREGEGYVLRRDNFFRDQFRRQLATGEKGAHGVDLWQLLREVSVPTLVLRGLRSDLFAETSVPKVLAANPRIRLQEIDAGHHIAGENPEATHTAVRSFIDSLEK
jgi:esterase